MDTQDAKRTAAVAAASAIGTTLGHIGAEEVIENITAEGSSDCPEEAGADNPEIHVVTSVHIVQPELDDLNIAPVDPEYVIIDEPMHGAPVDSGNILAVEPAIYGGPLDDNAWIDPIDEAGVEPTGPGDILDC